VQKITKEYVKGDQKIAPLKDADLTIDRGEFVSLMGASGSGKSTLLNLIAGIDRPTSGRSW
jgi:putative ABC transport system ATP-binding protein